jgi:hypothetical protein
VENLLTGEETDAIKTGRNSLATRPLTASKIQNMWRIQTVTTGHAFLINLQNQNSITV